MSPPPRLVLASTSRYRAELLARLGLPFESTRPEVDESPRSGEAPAELVARLAAAKARAGRGERRDALIIGSDQVAVIGDRILGKPGSHERAAAQLRAASGRRVSFLTGLALLDTRDDALCTEVVPFHVRFRALGDAEIEAYLEAERPYDAAGSFKSEGLGIALFEAMEGEDPTALVGLPLIRLCTLLRAAGLDPLLHR